MVLKHYTEKKLKNEQLEHHKKIIIKKVKVNSCVPERFSVATPLVAPVVQSLLH
jgi:hypothetical protein